MIGDIRKMGGIVKKGLGNHVFSYLHQYNVNKDTAGSDVDHA